MAHNAGQGPTKAHRIHLKHIIKQFRACEKRLASLLTKHMPAYLELLAEVQTVLGTNYGLLPCCGLLIETPDGRPFAAASVGAVRIRQSC
jgi:hypothetical protein